MEEIAHLGIVAVAQDCLVLEVLGVMPQLLLDVRKLGVKLILLRGFRWRAGFHSTVARHSSWTSVIRFKDSGNILVLDKKF